jgi:hypothetical protein
MRHLPNGKKFCWIKNQKATGENLVQYFLMTQDEPHLLLTYVGEGKNYRLFGR